MQSVAYAVDAPRRIRGALIGCGNHAYMNILPALRFAPVELVATCDIRGDRAAAYARQFGAPRSYSDHRTMLESESLDAVFVITSYDERGRPRYPAIAKDAMLAGVHVWMEKPPGASVEEVLELQALSKQTGRFVQVGLKKIFLPAVVAMREIIERPEFGPLLSLYATFPLILQPFEKRDDLLAMQRFLDVVWHPCAAIYHLAGPAETLTYEYEPLAGAAITTFTFRGGATGVLHHTAGEPAGHTAIVPEWLEVAGRDQTLVLDNCVRLTWYGAPGAPDGAALHWEPEFSRGTVYNSNTFLEGYGQEISHFVHCVLESRPPERAGLDACLEIMRWYEAYREPAGRPVVFDKEAP